MFDESHKAKLAKAVALADAHAGGCEDLPACSGIYVLLNKISRSMYVGQSHNIQRRAYSHIQGLRGGHQNPGVQADNEANGPFSFGFAMIEACGLDALDSMERAYIRAAASAGVCHNIMLVDDPQTNVERQRDWYARQKAEKDRQAELGRTEVRGIYAHPEDHPPIRAYAARMAAKRAKAKT